MKRLVVFFLSLSIIGALNSVNTVSSRPQAVLPINQLKSSQNSQLELSTNVIRQEYCESDLLRLRLRFRYENKGTETVIFCRFCQAITDEMFSRTYKDALEEKYIKELTPFVDPVLPKPEDRDSPNEELFVILQPGQSHEVDKDFPVLISDGTKETADYLTPGTYYVKLRVPTWWWGNDKGTELRNRWRRFGFL